MHAKHNSDISHIWLFFLLSTFLNLCPKCRVSSAELLYMSMSFWQKRKAKDIRNALWLQLFTNLICIHKTPNTWLIVSLDVVKCKAQWDKMSTSMWQAHHPSRSDKLRLVYFGLTKINVSETALCISISIHSFLFCKNIHISMFTTQ